MGRPFEEQLSEFVQALSLVDKDPDGCTPLEELVNFVKSFGPCPNEDELVDLISKVSLGHGNVDFGELLNQMIRKLKLQESDTEENDAEEEVKEVFKVFDKDQNGFITAKELRNVMISLGEKLTDEEAGQMIREADYDGDGLVNYEDFARMMATIGPLISKEKIDVSRFLVLRILGS